MTNKNEKSIPENFGVPVNEGGLVQPIPCYKFAVFYYSDCIDLRILSQRTDWVQVSEMDKTVTVCLRADVTGKVYEAIGYLRTLTDPKQNDCDSAHDLTARAPLTLVIRSGDYYHTKSQVRHVQKISYEHNYANNGPLTYEVTFVVHGLENMTPPKVD